ncbi:MAG: T9SS type A sorting domain-containing protein [Chitinophagales bacterium]|nr:T9SS type A sorting domain-containing protein [Bacteroidota bacterium]MBP7400927.1 T9SS type A sorting domain-containing protein [Chitinophagales bacterium]MBP8917996.1 T9SS type A sorting domain-containing protein [Chitinophagales bacterium]MBP9549994.1 T9SS type A sorting domain-containing protein [Chitinophagales bacterium]MBP9705896.1 T9SS type A sorting domain-containing protein [Chitinophagales bacterium]
MKRIFIFIACAICACNGFSQYDANWTFGDGLGWHFTEDTIVFFDSSIWGYEAMATISDSSGNLLFYTNGQNVWNKEQELMPNGTGLEIGQIGSDSAFGSSTTQGVLIIPKPNSSNIYYIFYIKNPPFGDGLGYSIIDLSLDDGKGDIIEKNINLNELDLTEKMQAVKHANGRDWWLVNIKYAPVFDGDSSYKFIKYLITPTEIEGPFIQEYGPLFDFTIGLAGVGQMKFNHQGNILANPRGIHVDLFDFDRCTGDFDNIYTIENVYEHGTYGCEFSSDGSKLYITTGIFSGSGDTELVQFCLDCKDEVIDSTRVIIYKENFGNYKLTQIQSGADDKMYVAMSYHLSTSGYVFGYPNMNLSVINSPNNLGLSCDFDTLSLGLNGKGVVFGLPNMPNYNLGALPGSGCDTVISGVINSEQLKNAITIYPNPASEYIIISGDINANDILKIYSADGRVVLQEKINTTNTKVNISKLPPGVYVIKISEDGLVKYSEKLFK